MTTYVVLIRGINVGGKNKVSMSALKDAFAEVGFTKVATYINSGNVVLDSAKSAKAVAAEIEKALPATFKLDTELIKVLVLTKASFKSMVGGRPHGFGEQPAKYHSDAIFLMGEVNAKDAFAAFTPRDGVDEVWAGKGVIFHQRLSVQRTKSRLSKIMATPFYKSMTIRNWATTSKLLEMLEA